MPYKEEDGMKTERLPKRLPTTVRRNRREDWVVIENTHEPLVTRETFDAAQAKRRVRSQDSSRSGRCHLNNTALNCPILPNRANRDKSL